MRLSLLMPALLLSSALSAQEITLRGKVEDGKGANQFVVDCSDTSLISSARNLNDFVGQHVLIKGTRVAAAGAPIVDVTSITPTKEIFEISGNPEIGQKLRFGASFTPGSVVSFYGAMGPGFQRVRRAGTFLLDPNTTFKAITTIIPSSGRIETAIRVPNDAALVGRTVYAQAALLSGGVLTVSNPDCKTIR